MSDHDYSDRDLFSAFVLGFHLHHDDAGEIDGISSTVRLALTSRDTPGQPGPTITVDVTFPIGPETPAQDYERAALSAAAAVLARLAEENTDSLHRCLRAQRPFLTEEP